MECICSQLKLIPVNLQIMKMECKVKKNEHF